MEATTIKPLIIINLSLAIFCLTLSIIGLNDSITKLQKYGFTYNETIIIENEETTRTVTFQENLTITLFFLLLAFTLIINTIILHHQEQTTTPKPYILT